MRIGPAKPLTATGQVLSIACISIFAASTTFRIMGAPERGVPCSAEVLKPGEICLAQVRDLGTDGVLWIDARPRTEWQADGVPGSILWNLDGREDANAFEENAMTHLLTGPPVVVVYCSEGNCGVSAEVAEKVRKLDETKKVYALHGGSGALKAEGMLSGSSSKP